MKILIPLLLLSTSAVSANISEFVSDGPIETTGTGSDLSGIAYGKTAEGVAGIFTVDNKTGVLTYPGGSCVLGGDLEGVSAGAVDGEFYILNEKLRGIRLVNVSASNCTDIAKAKTNLAGTGDDGLEGIVYHDNWLYYIDERSATVYKSSATITGATINPEVVFTVPSCFHGSGLAINGNNLVIACDNTDTLSEDGTIYEYTLDGEYVSELYVPGFGNVEGVTFNGNQMIVTGEPNQIQYFTGGDPVDPPPPPVDEFETCTYSGEVTINVNTGTWDAQVVNFVCPTLSASGTLN